MKAILLSGVHGVGKGYLLERIKTDLAGYKIYSASGMIEKYKESTDAGFKRVKNVKQNQEFLIASIKEETQKGGNSFILDGHLCILNADGKAERIPESFFERSGISGIILLQDDPRLIHKRITERDGHTLSTYEITNVQNEEKAYARELKEKYGINVIYISPDVKGKVILDWLKDVGVNNE